MKSYYKKKVCRLCNSRNLSKILDLGNTPPGNNLKYKVCSQKKFPLEVYFCQDCSHSQLGHVVHPSYLFQNNYSYLSSISEVFLKHLEQYSKKMINKFKLDNHSLVVDIGSNDGSCLSFFKKKSIGVVGVDPAKNIATIANKKGIKTIPSFFNSNVVKKILSNYGKADLITSHNCLAHIDNLSQIFNLSKKLLSKNGVMVLEVGYFYEVLKNNWFDTIYHEHLDYHIFSSLYYFFKKKKFTVFDVEIVKPQGGSLRIYLKKDENNLSQLKINNRVKKLLEKEKKVKLNSIIYYRNFSKNLDQIKQKLNILLKKIKNNNKIIYGYGAPTKATTLMNFFNIDSSIISYIFEDNPLKINKFTPNNIKIISANELNLKKPDYILILAWNFAESIIQKNKSFIKSGGKFIIPLPIPKIIK